MSSKMADVALETGDLDKLDRLILDHFLIGREAGEPWGKATPTEVRRALRDRGELAGVGDPVKQTIHNRMQRLELAGHLENRYDTGLYQLVSDPRE